MNWRIALQLGRVSNLPTVWTNTLTATVLAGGLVYSGQTLLILLSMTLFYVGGMYLNDAFDAIIDAQERPERPIPSGQVSRKTVMVSGFAMLMVGELLLLGAGLKAMLAGIALAIVIVAYNYHHKNNPLSPLLMALCRMGVYLAAGFAVVSSLPPALIAAAIVLLCYLMGLTYAAKQENLARMGTSWPLFLLAVPIVYGGLQITTLGLTALLCVALLLWVAMAVRFIMSKKPGGIPTGVVSLIAGISLLDAMLISAAGAPLEAMLALAAFALTLILQRFIAGT